MTFCGSPLSRSLLGVKRTCFLRCICLLVTQGRHELARHTCPLLAHRGRYLWLPDEGEGFVVVAEGGVTVFAEGLICRVLLGEVLQVPPAVHWFKQTFKAALPAG